jgi:hypothetical protein
VSSELKLHLEDKIYKVYMSNALYYQSHGKMHTKTFAQIIGLEKSEEDNRSGDEIALDIVNKLGLEVQR